MRECPVCKAIAFDDAEICYGCLYRFEEHGAAETPSTGAGSLTGSLEKGVAPSPASSPVPESAVGQQRGSTSVIFAADPLDACPADGSSHACDRGMWAMRIEFSGFPSRFDGMGMTLGRFFDEDGVVPRFAATDDGFVMSVGIPQDEAASAVSPPARQTRRRSARSSRSALRRRLSKASASAAGLDGSVDSAG